MPELPEVEITKLKLAPIIGKIILGFWTDMSKNLISTIPISEIGEDISNYSINTISRTGKVLFIHLSSNEKRPKIIAFHQRMSGRFKVCKTNEQPTKHTRLILTFRDNSQIHFIDPRKFGVVWYGNEKELNNHSYLNQLGPDALNVSFNKFTDRIKKFKGMVKPVLLRQDTVAGIGNIVVDETLWLSHIHPKTPVSHLTEQQLKLIHSSLQEVLQKSIQAKGSTLKDWKHPDEQSGTFVKYMNVYGKKGGHCLRCNTEIIRTVVGSRGTWICTTCQKFY